MSEDRIAVCSWSLRPDGPDDLLAALQRMRIGAVQLALAPALTQPQRWGRTIASFRQAGIRVVSGMMAMIAEDYSTLESIARTGGVRRDGVWPGNLKHAGDIAGLAADEGIDLVTFHAGFIPENRQLRERTVILGRLGEIAELFAERSVGLALETGQESAPTLLAALADLNCPGIGVNFDPANMILYGKGDPVSALRLLAPHVRQVHVKDARPAQVPGTWGTEVPIGSGAVDWPAFFKVALMIDPPVNFVIEREAGNTREAEIAAARDFVQRYLDE